MSEDCTKFITDYDDDEPLPLCRCPNCKGFLPRHFKDELVCKKCGEVLTILYDVGGHSGRICKMPDHLKAEAQK